MTRGMFAKTLRDVRQGVEDKLKEMGGPAGHSAVLKEIPPSIGDILPRLKGHSGYNFTKR